MVVGVATLGAGIAVVNGATGGPGAPIGAVQGAVESPGPTVSPTRTPRAITAASAEPSAVPAAAVPDPSAAADPTPLPIAELTGYQWPLPKGRLTLPFGPSPWGSRVVDGTSFHDGIDLATFCGDRVVAAHDGTVLAAGRRYDKYMGWVGDLGPYLRRLERKHLWSTLPIVVVIDDGNGYRSMYAHFGKVTVKRGQTVKAGQQIGFEGATGRASGCHVHYGLFSPLETATFRIDADVVKRMKVPREQIARVDPLLILPPRAKDRKERAASEARAAAAAASAAPSEAALEPTPEP
jgi:murein DD-endopeptidase MepM/ murein hydrolase activator NlpD